MYTYQRPVSEVAPYLYRPEPSQKLVDAALTETQLDWGFRLGHLLDQAGNSTPPTDNTLFVRIHPRGMTPPAHVIKPQHNARVRVNVLAGNAALIRAFASGGTEVLDLERDTEFTLRSGQVYACVNTGKDDVVLQGEASPAFWPDDEVALVQPYAKSEPTELTTAYSIVSRGSEGEAIGVINIERSLAPPARFYTLIDELASGRVKAWS